MENISMSTTGSKKSLLNQLWKMYIPYWPVFILLLGVAYGTAWYYLSTQPPLYESKARLLIKDEKKGMDDSKMIESLNLISTKKIVENEIELLTSRSLMSEVVLGLKLYAPIYFKGKWRDSSGYSSSSIKIDVRDPSILSEYSKIGFKEDTINAAIIIGGKSYRMNEWVNTPYGTLKFTRSKAKNPSTHSQQYFSLINPKEVTRSLMSKLEVTSSSKLSTVIDLKLKDEDPVLAEDVLNELIRSYNRAAVNDKNALTGNTLKFVQERLNIVGRHLNSIQKKIQQYKSDKGAVDISSQGKLFLENVSENDQKVSDVNMQLAVLDQVEKYVEQNNPNGGIVPSTLGIKDPLLSDLLEKLYDAELEKEKLKGTTGENSPLMESLSNQIDKIKPSIHENIRSQRRSLEATRTNLASTNSSYSTLLQSIPQKERDLVEISRQENIENTIYEFLLQKREEAALSNSSTVADNRVVDLAESTLKPVSPNRKLIYVISVIIALGTAAFIIAAKELFSSKILYRTEIETLSSYPVVAEIGYEKTKKQVVIQDGIKGTVAEQFRKL
ncbi:MAG TPA: GNVR domain-containing protein, partial [Flavitalea sp.]|nr:GNVR domain-containing protein [Flavitalea sp.]